MTARRTRPAPPTATRISSARHHSLAPEHLGELGGVAALGVLVVGFAIFIAGVAMTVGGITIAGSFGENPLPPNIGELGLGQVFGGAGLMVLGVVLSAGSIATFAAVPGARRITAVLSGLTAVLAGAGFGVLVTEVIRDLVLSGALGVAAILFGVAAVILGRRTA